MPERQFQGSDPKRKFVLSRETWTILLTLAAGWLLWRLRFYLLLVFGGVLIAILLDALTDWICRHTHLHRKVVFAGVLLTLAILVVAGVWLFGQRLTTEFGEIDTVKARLSGFIAALPPRLRTEIEDLRNFDLAANLNLLGPLTGYLGIALGVLSDIAIVLFLGIFFAASPATYGEGFVSCLPEHIRPRAAKTLNEGGIELRRWLLGQLISMAAVGILTGAGLLVLGVPMAFSLGLLAGLLEFIPFIGPFVAGAAGLVVTLALAPHQLLWTALMYLAVQQIEGQILTPFVNKWAVDLPPALTLSASVAFGLLFGPMGIVVGVPLAVLCKAFLQANINKPAAPTRA